MTTNDIVKAPFSGAEDSIIQNLKKGKLRTKMPGNKASTLCRTRKNTDSPQSREGWREKISLAFLTGNDRIKPGKHL
jgi:hypothetical protein